MKARGVLQLRASRRDCRRKIAASRQSVQKSQSVRDEVLDPKDRTAREGTEDVCTLTSKSVVGNVAFMERISDQAMYSNKYDRVVAMHRLCVDSWNATEFRCNTRPTQTRFEALTSG